MLSCAQCADIFTKVFTAKATWKHACDLINHVVPEKFFADITGREETAKEDTTEADAAQVVIDESLNAVNYGPTSTRPF